ncbi:hypothetical protein SLITO_v1c04080 [Spiroplasma litorale]|uniref:Uncharacterized protein n=1 Tax=Spiroplasma litorale TaxID=216942 RepID=A0A0K1W1K1_9MOLU|nr:hypothetical protein [Spiroplasma litorale]AKX34061.1 hypothetical protein SLITO_v1c04080 [Spiroplasma litorale]
MGTENQMFDSNIEFSDSVGTKSDTKLKAVKRPAILADNFSKVDLIKQSRVLMSSKKGKANINELPAGVRVSIKNKERIEKILNTKDHSSTEEIRKKLYIEGKPLNKKRAEELREERISFFQKNINKSKSGHLDKMPDFSKPVAIKKTAVKSLKELKMEEINNIAKSVKKTTKSNTSAKPKTSATTKTTKNASAKSSKSK